MIKIDQIYQGQARQAAMALWSSTASEYAFKNIMVPSVIVVAGLRTAFWTVVQERIVFHVQTTSNGRIWKQDDCWAFSQ
jgi:deoxyhypusine synthase